MADLVFNVAKGRVAQLAINVDTGAPANSRLILHAFDATGAVEDTIRDATTITAVEAVANVTERTTGGWVRKTLAAADVTITVDNTNNWVDIDIPDQTWTTVTTGVVTRLMFSYDPDNTAGTDTDLIPLTTHDFSITPDGSDVTAQIATAGFFRAQ